MSKIIQERKSLDIFFLSLFFLKSLFSDKKVYLRLLYSYIYLLKKFCQLRYNHLFLQQLMKRIYIVLEWKTYVSLWCESCEFNKL